MSGSPAPATDEARGAADRAARAAALRIRELSSPADHRAAQDLFVDLWQANAPAAPVSADLLRSLAHFGGYVAGAELAGGSALIGASAGFLGGAGAQPYLHSHITGVAAPAQGRGAGYALKLHQRAWAADRGLGSINWTFDPLQQRNAVFNLGRLAGRPTQYLVDFYGDMQDGVNAGQGSDRLVVEWPLADDAVVAACAGRWSEPAIAELLADRRVLLEVGSAGEPCPGRPAGAGSLLCCIPADIAALRRSDPALAIRWRHAVRDTLGAAMADGYAVAGVTRAGWYLLEAP